MQRIIQAFRLNPKYRLSSLKTQRFKGQACGIRTRYAEPNGPSRCSNQEPRTSNLTHVDFTITGDELWGRMNRAVEKIQKRLERTVATLASADIPFAVIGGLAVRAWVAQADEAAVRTTRDVDILINRGDLPRAIVAMENAEFVYKGRKGNSRVYGRA